MIPLRRRDRSHWGGRWLQDARRRLRTIDDDPEAAGFAPDVPGQADLFPADPRRDAKPPTPAELTKRISHRIVRGDP